MNAFGEGFLACCCIYNLILNTTIMKLFTFAYSLITYLVVSCSLGAEEKKFSMFESIQPRNVGARWIYKSVYYEDGKKVPGGTTKEEVIKVQNIEGIECFHIRLTFDWRSLKERLFGVKLHKEDYMYFWDYTNKNGSYNFDPTDEKKSPNKLTDFELHFPHPIEKGKKYKVEDIEYQILDTKRITKVPAGEFNCVVYESVTPSKIDDEGKNEVAKSRDRFFMAKGVGAVIVEGEIWEDGKWVPSYRDELFSYDLKLVE